MAKLTALCRSEPELLVTMRHFPGDGWGGAELVQRRPECGEGRWPHVGRLSLCSRLFSWDALCRAGKEVVG